MLPTDSMRRAYHGANPKGNRGVEYPTPEQCYGCSKVFTQKKSFENRMKTCSSMPSIVYKFDNQNISTFEDNYRLMGNLSFGIYFDFKTTCEKKLTILKRELNCILFLILSQLLFTPTFVLRELLSRGVLLTSLTSLIASHT